MGDTTFASRQQLLEENQLLRNQVRVQESRLAANGVIGGREPGLRQIDDFIRNCFKTVSLMQN